ncbi:MAG: MaoC family dehydratase [Pirellulales bacterium]
MSDSTDRLAAIRQFYGKATRVSGWLTVDQSSIDRFAEATRDADWIHCDPERAREEGPFGGTIAFGFWTISLLTYFLRQMTDCDYPAGATFGYNYGFDRVRFTTPVRVGASIRATSRLLDVQPRGADRYLVKTENHIEVQGEQKPAMVCEWLVLLVYDEHP